MQALPVVVRSPYAVPLVPPASGAVVPPPAVDAFEASFVEPVVSWRKAVLAGLSVLGAVGGMMPAPVPPPAMSLSVTTPLSFPKMSPYVASMAAEVWASMQGEITDQVLFLPMPRHFGSSVRVGLGLQNGPDAPMSADDFVLTESNVAEFRSSSRVQVVEHGGHGGLFFSPEARETLGEVLKRQ